MKEEIKRIMRLVQEGKLSPDDAAELIDAFGGPDPDRQAAENATPPPPPPPPPSAEATSEAKSGAETTAKDPIHKMIDAMEALGKDVAESVNWQDVARQVRIGAQKGVDSLKEGVERIRREGKFDFGIFGAQEVRTIELPIGATATKSLKIENPVGSVKIFGGAETASVKAVAKVRGMDQAEAKKRAAEYTLIVEETDRQVLIRQPDVSGLQVDLEVNLPDDVDVDARTWSGDLVVNSVGAATLNAASGNISLAKANGLVDIVSQSGSVTIVDTESPTFTLVNKSGNVSLTRVRGSINIRTASGDLSAIECSGKSISIESVSGNVTVDINTPFDGAASIRTVNGSSTLSLMDGSNCRVALSTLRGHVICETPLEDDSRSDMHVTGRLGDGSGSVDVSAVNGGITMKFRNQTV